MRAVLREAFTTREPMTRFLTCAALVCAALLPAVGTAQTPAAAPAAPAAAPAGDPNKGAQKVAMCQGCHGIPGWRTAFPEVYRVPKLSGQNPAYIVAALKEYKSRNRSHPSMIAIAASLSDEDMANLAAYFALTPLKTASQ
jgi:cytochrome c553